MKLNLLKRYSLLLIVLLVLMLVGCQRVSDARTELGDALAAIAALATDFKSVKVDEPVDEFKAKVETLQAKLETLDRLAELVPGPVLDKLVTTVDEVVQAADTASGKTLGPAAETINAAGAGLESIYLELDDAICAEK